ncbi:hypothetical protein DM01DRAFT_1379465 [Hesseltinella vesiculosa]|uniref:Gem-associated protein 2 n=1 Tax=Hesseltinella vesiculosa TaxID=101127 RepID=A0A1X2GYX3_9FUNG|nr:hypothetical protein DM01DRAFT_1379465 [Hesseltinella vesiculosa]
MKFKRDNEGNDNGEIKNKAALPTTRKRAKLVNGIPASGEDYVLFVREQAKGYSDTAVAPPPTSILKSNLPPSFRFTEETPVDPALLCSSEWQAFYADAFTRYKKTKSGLSTMSKTRLPPVAEKQQWRDLVSKPVTDNKLDDLQKMKQKDLLLLMKYIREWLLETEQEQHYESFTAWLYSCLVFLDPVMTFSDSSILRNVCRAVIEVRAKAGPDSPHLPQFNIVITIVSRVFGQSDLM